MRQGYVNGFSRSDGRAHAVTGAPGTVQTALCGMKATVSFGEWRGTLDECRRCRVVWLKRRVGVR